MYKVNRVLLFLVLCIFISCHETKKGNSKNGSIEISYLKGTVETMIPIRCGSITSAKSTFTKKDTVLFDKRMYYEIVNQIANKLKLDSLSSNCDSRIECKVNLMNGDSIKLCIGNFNCIIKGGQKMVNNDTLVYLIRKYSGYYNYFHKEDLNYFPEIKLFGIPNDYKNWIREQDPNKPPLPPSKIWLN